MSPVELVRAAREAGLRLRVDGDRLFASPTYALTEDLHEALEANRAEVVAFLNTEPPAEGRLLDGGRRWIPPPIRPGWCPCDQAVVWDEKSGLCRTCHAAVFGERIWIGGRR